MDPNLNGLDTKLDWVSWVYGFTTWLVPINTSNFWLPIYIVEPWFNLVWINSKRERIDRDWTNWQVFSLSCWIDLSNLKRHIFIHIFIIKINNFTFGPGYEKKFSKHKVMFLSKFWVKHINFCLFNFLFSLRLEGLYPILTQYNFLKTNI